MAIGQVVDVRGDVRTERIASRAVDRQSAKQKRIVEVAMEHFAADGYEGTRIEAIAKEAGVSKGAIFNYFTSKAGLFFATYQAGCRSLSQYLDAPADVVSEGFFAILTYWMEHTPHLIREDWVPYRVTLLGNYCTDLRLRREITQWMSREDPYGTRAFVQFGVERGEIRRDVEARIIVSLVDWLMDRCQDAIVTEELDPALFALNATSPEELRTRVLQFVELLRGALAAR
jgi:AcrR family transcriptional regulator